MIVITIGLWSTSTSAKGAGKAVEFNKSSEFISIQSGALTASQDRFTICVYLKPEKQSGGTFGPTVISNTDNKGYALRINNGFVFADLRVKKKNKLLFEGAYVRSRRWSHVAVTYDGSAVRVYVDGEYKGEMAASGTIVGRAGCTFIGSEPTGCKNAGGNYGFNGQIDELSIWKRSLSGDEIKSIMQRELKGNEAGLIAYYNFNSIGPGGTIEDISGNGNDGTIHGAHLVSSGAPVKDPYPIKLVLSTMPQNPKLKAGQTIQVSVRAMNAGQGIAENVRISFKCDNPNVVLGDARTIKSIQPGVVEKVDYVISGTEQLERGVASLMIEAIAGGKTSAETSINLDTEAHYSQPVFPADLYIEDVMFVEPSGNNALDGYEKGEIRFRLINNGRGVAQNIKISLSSLSSAENLSYESLKTVDSIKPKESKEISFLVTASGRVITDSRVFRIQVVEEFGFDADPARISFETRTFNPPDLRIEKVAINDSDNESTGSYGNGNSIIEPNESVVVTAFVQNFGSGEAENVKVSIRAGEQDRNFTCPDNGNVTVLGDIAPGDYKSVNFYFYTNRRFTKEDIPVKIEITESKGDYGKTIDLGLKMNIRTPNIVETRVASIDLPKPEFKKIAEVSKSDIDDPPLTSKTRRQNGLAIIIGIENYKYAPKVTYAERDAGAFYNYTEKVLGIPDRNIYYLMNDGATSGEFEKIFDREGWIAKRSTVDTEIFIYYCGHGAPSIKEGTPYLIPYDIDPNYATTGFALSKMYETLNSIKSKAVVVFLDACFSGQNRESEMLLADARPAFIKVERPETFGDITVMSAASGVEISSGDPDKRHGIFTYFLLKGLQGPADLNRDNKITVSEIFSYIKPNVQKIAGQLDREQTPVLISDEMDYLLVEY